ncbi:unnamed protein product [Ostreobium quekettii]|uniref:DEX1 C-terminal domain-containing protein n=1 Tax=Ostreobium quekettii TaxID=121088 RepID=A0A8S1IQ85_9CHLO|nr:unnamed protein product [Ostreobium quekettii]
MRASGPAGPQRLRRGCAILVLLLALCGRGACQLNQQFADEGEEEENKFRTREAELDVRRRSRAPPEDEDEDTISHCSHKIHLRWMTEVSSSVYSTPLITDLYSDGHKDIVVPSFVHYLEVLEAEDGAKAVGWPAFHQSTVHTSPFLYDIDRDGIQDIGIATYDGEILFYKDTGAKLPQSLLIPKLPVKKDWYVGLNEDPMDHSNPDVGDGVDPFKKAEEKAAEAGAQKATQGSGTSDGAADSDATVLRRRRLQDVERSTDMALENEHKLTQEAAESFKSLEEDEDSEEGGDIGGVYGGVYDYQGDVAERYADYIDEAYRGIGMNSDDFWGDEEFEGRPQEKKESSHVYIDSHVLSTPVVADIDQDGVEELVVSVSYFFDRDYYDSAEHRGELGEGVEPSHYIASGIVVFDLYHKYVKWTAHLDLSSDKTKFRAYLYTAPTVVDIDGDGNMEVVVGTSYGFLYVLDHLGSSRQGWPKQMAGIEGQALVADLNGDGEVEIFAGDTRGSVAMFDISGNELWERHLASLISAAPTAGDVDGDGRLEVVVGTASGHIFVLDGATGEDKSPFPFRTHGRIMESVLITRLHSGPSQQLVVVAFDGYMYAIDGETACVEAVDVGETSYSMVLADDLNDDGKMELVVATMNGNVYMFETGGDYHPLKTWPAQVQSVNGMVARHRWVGIYALKSSRVRRDVRGDKVEVTFRIVDYRPLEGKRGGPPPKGHGPYNVTVMLKGVGVKEMNAGGTPVIGVMETYTSNGTYTVVVPCPRSRATATIFIEMTDRHRLSYTDEFSLSFHMHWYKLVKWLLALPFAAMVFTLIAIKAPLTSERYLPS